MTLAVTPSTEGFTAEWALERLKFEMSADVVTHLCALFYAEIFAEKAEQSLPLAVCLGVQDLLPFEVLCISFERFHIHGLPVA